MHLHELYDHLFIYLFLDSVQKIPKWNFWKFLVNPEGKVVRFWKADESMESIRQEVATLVREIIIKKRGELWRWTMNIKPLSIFRLLPWKAGTSELWWSERAREPLWTRGTQDYSCEAGRSEFVSFNFENRPVVIYDEQFLQKMFVQLLKCWLLQRSVTLL